MGVLLIRAQLFGVHIGARDVKLPLIVQQSHPPRLGVGALPYKRLEMRRTTCYCGLLVDGLWATSGYGGPSFWATWLSIVPAVGKADMHQKAAEPQWEFVATVRESKYF